MSLTPAGKTQLFGKISTLMCYELSKKCDYYYSTRGKILTPQTFPDYLIAVGETDGKATDVIIVELGSAFDSKSKICVKEILEILEISFDVDDVRHFIYVFDSNNESAISSGLIGLNPQKDEPLVNDLNLTKIHSKIYTLISFLISNNSKDWLEENQIEKNFYNFEVTDEEGQIIKLKDFLEHEVSFEYENQIYEDVELKFYNALDQREIVVSENKDFGLFLVRGMFDLNDRPESMKNYETEIEKISPATVFFINGLSKYEDVCKHNENVHEVIFDADWGLLNWVRSSKDFSVLREFLIHNIMHKRDDAEDNSLKIIRGSGTCGKTMCLRKIYKETKNKDFSKWVCLLNGEFLEHVFEDEDKNIERVLSKLLKVNTKVETAVLSKSISIDDKIILLFDDVDSLPKKTFQNAVNFILNLQRSYPTIKMFVTARDSLRNFLEKNCGVISHEISELTEEQEDNLLKKLLPPLNSDEIKELELTVEKANAMHIESDFDRPSSSFTKNPFNLFLITEMYKNHGLENSFSKISVYENYLAWNEMHSEDFEKFALYVFCDTEPEMTSKEFPKTDTIFNIDRYMNRSIIEFLVAKYFYYRHPEELTPDLRVLKCMKSIVNIFDRKMFKDFPIMELVFNNNLEAVEKMSIEENIFDCLNRNPLHIIRDMHKMAKLFLNSKYDVNHKDCFGWTPLRYADLYKDLRMINFYLENGGCEEDLVKLNTGPVEYVQTLFPKVLEQNCATLTLYILNNRNDFTVTPYHVSCATTYHGMDISDRIKILKVMATKITDQIDIKWTSSALYEVLDSGNLELVTILVEKFNLKIEDCEIEQIKSIDILKYSLEKIDSIFSEKQIYAIFMRACQQGSKAIIKYSIEEQKLDIYKKDDSGLSAMSQAVYWSNDIDTVNCLYDLGFKDFTQLDDDNKTCLHYACEGDNLKIIQFLVNHGADLHAKTLSNNKYPIDFVGRVNALEIINFLISKGSPMISTESVNLILICNSLENVKKFDEKYKIDWNYRDSFDNTVLQHFIKYGADLDVFKYVVEHSNVDYKSEEGLTALHLAFQWDKRDMIFNVLQNVCDDSHFNAVTDSGESCMHFALSGSTSFQAADFLIGKGLDINSRDNKGRTPVHSMYFNCSKELADKVIMFGLDVNAKDNEGKTVLHYAVESDSYFVLEYIKYCLIDLKIDPSICDDRKRIALHSAVELGRLNVLETFARHAYCDVNAKDIDGKTPVMIAETFGEDIFNFLKEVEANQNGRD